MHRIDRPAFRISGHQRRAAALAEFVRRYGRKAQSGVEPNGRQYNRDLEKSIKRMDPEFLDRLLRDEDL